MTHPLPAFVGLYAGLPIMQPAVISDVHNYSSGANPFCVNPATCNYFHGNHVCTTVENPTSTVIWINLKVEREAEDKLRIQGAKYQGRLDSLVSKHVLPSVANYFAKTRPLGAPISRSSASATASSSTSYQTELGKATVTSESKGMENLIQCALSMASITPLELQDFAGSVSVGETDASEPQAVNNVRDHKSRETDDTIVVGSNISVSENSFAASGDPDGNCIEQDALPDNESRQLDGVNEEITTVEILESSVILDATVSGEPEVINATVSASDTAKSGSSNGAFDQSAKNSPVISPENTSDGLVYRRLKKHEWMMRWLYNCDNVPRVVQRTSSTASSPYLRQRCRSKGSAKVFHIIQSPVLLTGAKGSVSMDFMEAQLDQSPQAVRALDNLKMLSDVAYARTLSSTSGSSHDIGEQDYSDDKILARAESFPLKIRPKLKPPVQDFEVLMPEEEDDISS